MQRQSLGSPNSKLLQVHGGGGGLASPKPIPHIAMTEPTESNRKDSSPSSSSLADDDDQRKSLKPRRLSLSQSPPSKPENLIHIIPLLTLICFLILYFSSHTPSQSDLTQFNGFKGFSNHKDSSKLSRFVELDRGDVLAFRSLRNLQEVQKNVSKSKPHRKFADF
ncbi:hypothetical protein CFOL_v3_23327 [Cephalotus follicularis]|uniref:Uncharacterized protein n=1 Tax=Cephalotus follicularis TaxID=3775 RepID=A0A1Q3CHX0_CEPFO|nr:hypothetical protein CFOL_v3_23327 [Cephalotus follicularis]